MAYRYDQLHRIRISASFASNGSTSWTFDDKYTGSFTYDGNGNLQNLQRGAGIGMPGELRDGLTYHYNTNQPNQLEYVTDGVNASIWDDDFDSQSAGNYTYDAIGNMISDDSEEISNIVWNIFGKVEAVNFSPSSGKNNISYTYDPAGNRLTKSIDLGNGQEKKTIYTRDASGNVMSIYDKTITLESPNLFTTIQQKEIPLYGSSRLGLYQVSDRILSTDNPGNTVVTLSDKVLGQSETSSTTLADYYEAEVVSAKDYYPFGLEMPGRSFSAPSYRYGFNGKEDDRDWGMQNVRLWV